MGDAGTPRLIESAHPLGDIALMHEREQVWPTPERGHAPPRTGGRDLDWYNGYSPAERAAMDRCTPSTAPPCSMCGDPAPSQMQVHAEDYSRPYIWHAPATYPVCRLCHARLHRRFIAPAQWLAFGQFLRRGWYAREVAAADLHRLVQDGATYGWRQPPHAIPHRSGPHAFWWESLTLDPASKMSPIARPRP